MAGWERPAFRLDSTVADGDFARRALFKGLCDESLATNNSRYAVVSPVTKSDLEGIPLSDQRESWCLLVQDNT
jgi:hypothetical protein